MANDSRFHSRLAALFAAAALAMLATSCDISGNDPTDPGGDPEPGPVGDARLTYEVLVPASAGLVAESAPDWSADDAELVYAGPPGSTVWALPSRDGDAGRAVTDPELGNWLTGSYAPGWLGDGSVAYALNWHGNELGMFLLLAPPGSVEGDPAPQLLHLFEGIAVGLAENQFSSPQALTYSAAGDRAAGTWRSSWLLDWRADTLSTRSPAALAGGSTPRLSRDGERLVFTDDDGAVVWMGFEEEIGENVGEGFHPSWRGDGDAIGYLGANGHFGVYDLESRRTVWYRIDGPAPVLPVLSNGGTRVAYLFRDAERGLGLAVGDLLVE